MNPTFVLVTFVTFVVLQNLVTAQRCTTQPIFPANLPNPNPLLCDGDAGGTEISILSNQIQFTLLGGSNTILGFPGKQVPNTLNLVIERRPNGDIDRAKSYIMLNSRKFIYGRSGRDRRRFRNYFNILQVFVRQFETGACPIDSKGQVYPELASVRGSLLSLASLFGVRDCSGGNTM